MTLRRDEIVKLWEELLQKLDARRARLDRTIALQKIFQSIILLNDSIDETKDSLEMNQGSNMIEGICSDQESTDRQGTGPNGSSSSLHAFMNRPGVFSPWDSGGEC